MNWAECWDSVSCLESAGRVLTSWGNRLAIFAGVIGLFVVVLKWFVPAYIENRISVLSGPRHFSGEQRFALQENIVNAPRGSVYLFAYLTDGESQSFAGELRGAFRDAGWTTHGPVLYTVEDEPRPRGWQCW